MRSSKNQGIIKKKLIFFGLQDRIYGVMKHMENKTKLFFYIEESAE